MPNKTSKTALRAAERTYAAALAAEHRAVAATDTCPKARHGAAIEAAWRASERTNAALRVLQTLRGEAAS